MASTTVFLLYACALLPLLAAEEDNDTCFFPFIYGGELYYSCTGEGTKDGTLWCATTPNYDTDDQWKWCTVQEYGGTSGGKPCQFPFTYLGKTYYFCTTKNSHKPWCATTGSYNIDKQWSYCGDMRPTADPCYFPFKFNNTFYTTCIPDDSSDGKPWCSSTQNYDLEPKRVVCETSGGCTFPFIFQGKLYYSCTSDGTTDGQLWCATTPDYDKHRMWKTCVLKENGGNSNGAPCYFPFKYKEEIYYNCTSVDEPSGRLWCATTEDYNIHGKWTFCGDPAPPTAEEKKSTCVFPFIYNGKTYSFCIIEGSASKRPWCALTSNYDIKKIWKYCDSSEIERGCSQKS